MRTVAYVVGAAIVGYFAAAVITGPLMSQAPSPVLALVMVGATIGCGYYGYRQAQRPATPGD